MLKKIKSFLLRYLFLLVLSCLILGSLMYAYSRLKFHFRWGDNWRFERNYDWIYFIKMTFAIFPFIILVYFLFYWAIQSLFHLKISNHKIRFLLLWCSIFGIWIGLVVAVNTIGNITVLEFIKVAIISGIVGSFIPILDFVFYPINRKG